MCQELKMHCLNQTAYKRTTMENGFTHFCVILGVGMYVMVYLFSCMLYFIFCTCCKCPCMHSLPKKIYLSIYLSNILKKYIAQNSILLNNIWYFNLWHFYLWHFTTLLLAFLPVAFLPTFVFRYLVQ